MTFLGRWRGRGRATPVLDPPGYRLAAPPAPPPFQAPPAASAVPGPVEPVEPPRAKPAMRLMMEDGTMQDLPADPEIEARAEYLIKSMLPPAPPPPPASS